MPSPVNSYGPMLLQFYKKAALGEIVVNLPDDKSAHRLRLRLYQLRTALRFEHHVLARIANTVSLYVESNPSRLIGRPADSTFIEALNKAGVSIEEVTELEGEILQELHEPGTPMEGESLAMEELLEEQLKKK